MGRLFAILAGLILVASPCWAASSADMQQVMETVTGFYQVHQASTQDGVPDTKQRSKYEQFISPELDTLLSDGDAAEALYAKRNPDSPPMVEGDLFSPNFEGISFFKIGHCAEIKSSVKCKVELRYVDPHPPPQDKPIQWVDTVTLVETASGWRVDDIAYGGTWDFGNHGTLKGLLKDVIADASK